MSVQWWDDYPAELVICQDALQLGTTWERLVRHLCEHHGYSKCSWILSNRCQQEIENYHNQEHGKGKTSNHKHDKPVVIVGYEPKPKVEGEKPYLTWKEYNGDC